jgi:prepilin-type N-terminal cleavage/methylation domain-containing protein
MKRAAAFTLIEIIIAMILSGLAITLSYSILHITTTISGEVSKMITKSHDILHLNQILLDQVVNAKRIDNPETNTLEMTFNNRVKSRIVLVDSLFTIDGDINDSIYFSGSYGFVFLSDSLLEQDYVSSLFLKFNSEVASIEFHYNKTYSADFYINNQKH